jgi:hypothetical protein
MTTLFKYEVSRTCTQESAINSSALCDNKFHHEVMKKYKNKHSVIANIGPNTLNYIYRKSKFFHEVRCKTPQVTDHFA